MLVSGSHLFAPDTPVEDCARLAALMEAMLAGRLVWDKPAVFAVVHPGYTLVTVVLCVQEKGNTMTGQQRTAFLHPCFEADECSHGRYRVQRQTEGVRLSVIVTVNIGLE